MTLRGGGGLKFWSLKKGGPGVIAELWRGRGGACNFKKVNV